MKFDDYLKLYDCVLLEKTEQSCTYITFREEEKRVVKRYSTEFDKLREELAYSFINSRSLLKVPKLKMIEDDFIEMESLESKGTPSIEEIIRGISEMYIRSLNDSKPKEYFPIIDLTKNKLLKRLEYIPVELEKRGIINRWLFDESESFVNERYVVPEHYCLVHGDLKSPHTIKTERGLFFIDLALVAIANPWYDLAFLYMERINKEETFEELCDRSYEFFGRDFSVSEADIKDFLQSSIFYRCLYNVGFAARHRKDKSLIRTLNELHKIIEH